MENYNHFSSLFGKMFGLKSLVSRFGLTSRRPDVRYPKIMPTDHTWVAYIYTVLI